MIPETTVDWKAFEYKYSENPQSAFENLTYYLFCHEFNQKNGIFRYFNQPHIETNPIQVGDELVGFQAKYYQDSIRLSSKKDELEKAIEGASNTYHGIKKLYFYISREFTPSSKKNETKPDYQIALENKAKELGITIEWKGKSHIEAQLMLYPELSICRNIYFQDRSEVQDCCKQLNEHRDDLFQHIKTSIKYKDNEIILKHNDFKLDAFLNSENQALVVHGCAGSGKSALIKKILISTDDDTVVLAFKSTDIDVDKKNKFMHEFGNLTLDELLTVYKESQYRILYIDAIEKFYDIKNQKTFEGILRAFIDSKWKIVFTVRNAYKESLLNRLLANVRVEQFCINTISDKKFISLAEVYDFQLPRDKRLRDLLCTPFYLGLYLSLDNIDKEELAVLNKERFEEKVWNERIRNNTRRIENMPNRREEVLTKITMDMLQKERYFYRSTFNDDHAAFSALKNSGIIIQLDDAEKYIHAHDVFEELVVNHIFTNQYKDYVTGKAFFEKFYSTLRTRKLFRNWLAGFASVDEHHNFILQILRDENVDIIWKDEILLTIVSTEDLKGIFDKLVWILKSDGYVMLKKILFLVNTCCRAAEYPEAYFINGNVQMLRFTKPIGYAWESLFVFILENKAFIKWDDELFANVINVLDAWTKHAGNSKTKTTKFAGKIGLWMFEKIVQDSEFFGYIKQDQIQRLYSILLNSAWMIKEGLEEIFQNVIDDQTSRKQDDIFLRYFNNSTIPGMYTELAKWAISDILHCGRVPYAMPEMVLKLIKSLWLKQTADIEDYSTDIEYDFGLDDHFSRNYYSASALKTSIMAILNTNQKLATDFLIDLFNKTGETYDKSNFNVCHKETFKIIIYLKDRKIEQIASFRFWNMYRGTSVGPDSLISLLMGFEKWLFEFAKKSDKQVLTEYCQNVLMNSKNVMLTAVIVSIAEAFPQKMIDIICDLLKTKEIFRLDGNRLAYERQKNAYFLYQNDIFIAERKESDELPHRKVNLETVILKYQTDNIWKSEEEFVLQKKKVFAAIDQATEDIQTWQDIDKFPYYRIDIRRYQDIAQISTDENGNALIITKPKITKNMELLRSQQQDISNRRLKYVDLWIWAKDAFRRESKKDNINDKYSDITVVYREMEELWDILNSSKAEEDEHIDKTLLLYQRISTVSYVSVVLLRDYSKVLDEDKNKNLCQNIIYEIADYYTRCSKIQFKQSGNGVEAIVQGLCLLLGDNIRNIYKNEFTVYLLLLLVLKDTNWDSDVIYQIANNLWKNNQTAGKQLIYLFSLIADQYQEEKKRNQDFVMEDFFENHVDIVLNSFDKKQIDIGDIDFTNISEATIFAIISLVSPETEYAFFIAEATKDTAMRITFGNEHLMEEYRRVTISPFKYIVWFADLLLYCYDFQRKKLINSFLQRADFSNYNNIIHLLDAIIQKQDISGKTDELWAIWELLKERMIEVSNERNRAIYSNYNGPIGRDAIITGYLFANVPWKENVHQCALLSEEKALFFDEFIDKSDNFKSILYAISRLLNTVGQDTYYEHGVEWMYRLVQKDPECKTSLYENTLFYMENYIGSYANRHKMDFREKPELTRKIQCTLEYMVNQGSEVAFFIREQI